MASWSDWFKEANELKFPLKDVFPVNLPNDAERLYSSGLPTLERLFLNGADYTDSKVAAFCDKHPLNWVRVYHKTDLDKRKSKYGVPTQEILDFIHSLKLDISQFTVQLFESPVNQFGGNILSDKERTVIEIAEGPQDIVGKCLGHFFHGKVIETGRLAFLESDAPVNLRRAAQNSLNYLKLARGEYIPGYFEFVVSDKNETYFLDYKEIFLERKTFDQICTGD